MAEEGETPKVEVSGQEVGLKGRLADGLISMSNYLAAVRAQINQAGKELKQSMQEAYPDLGRQPLDINDASLKGAELLAYGATVGGYKLASNVLMFVPDMTQKLTGALGRRLQPTTSQSKGSGASSSR